jgi:hypothetical protein
MFRCLEASLCTGWALEAVDLALAIPMPDRTAAQPRA